MDVLLVEGHKDRASVDSSLTSYELMTSPKTRPSLIIRIADPQDEVAWGEFVDIYEPILIRVGKSKGLQDVDARELAQDVLVTVLKSISTFKLSTQVGSFRRWLATITSNKLRDRLRAQQRSPIGIAPSGMDWNRICDRTVEDINASLEKQWQHQMFARAVVSIKCHVQPDTWQAFWRASIDLVSPEEVAKELGTTVGNVYVARSRVIAKLRSWVHQNADHSTGELS